MANRLSAFESRTDLTDRECAKIIGGLLGSLSLMVDDVATLRNAVRWWADENSVWESFKQQAKAIQNVMETTRTK